jgi:hypothetical protein
VTKIAVIGDGLGITLTVAIKALLEKEGHEIVELQREPEPPVPSFDPEDLMYKPNRKERRADAARARRRR